MGRSGPKQGSLREYGQERPSFLFFCIVASASFHFCFVVPLCAPAALCRCWFMLLLLCASAAVLFCRYGFVLLLSMAAALCCSCYVLLCAAAAAMAAAVLPLPRCRTFAWCGCSVAADVWWCCRFAPELFFVSLLCSAGVVL